MSNSGLWHSCRKWAIYTCPYQVMTSPPFLYSLHLRNNVLNVQLQIWWKRNIHYRIHNSSLIVSVLYHTVTLPICTKLVSKLYYHLVHFPWRFPDRNFVGIFWSLQCVLHSPLSSFTPKWVARSIQSVSPIHVLKIHFNISPQLQPRPHRLDLSLTGHPQSPVCILPLPLTCYTPC